MNRTLLILCGAVFLATGHAACAAENRKDAAPDHYDINPDAVARVEILYYPERILTRAGLTPARLEQLYRYKIEIREFADTKEKKELAAMLKENTFSPSRDSYDLRTAVLFYDRSGKRLLSLYFDQSGRNGVVNTESVTRNAVLSSNFSVYRWAKAMMSGFER